MIVVEEGYLRAIHLRPWPKIFSASDLWGSAADSTGGRPAIAVGCTTISRAGTGDFLALKFVVSSREATFGTFRSTLIVLDEIARIKGTDAIVAEVRNPRISDRLLRRWGWESHLPTSRRRHFIKRFYGTYPDPHRVGPDRSERWSPAVAISVAATRTSIACLAQSAASLPAAFSLL